MKKNKILLIGTIILIGSLVLGWMIYDLIKTNQALNRLSATMKTTTEDRIDARLEKQRLDKIKLEQTLKQIDVMVINKTIDGLGSGVTIKYKDKFYILTAGHMAQSPTDEIYLFENNNKICQLEIVKQDYSGDIDTASNDLLLLRPINPNIEPKFYTEIAENEPVTGTQVYIVGNPMGIEDVISDGRVAIYQGNFMYYIDHTYFGNSGGGVYTENGKLVGIVSHMRNLKPMEGYSDYIINGAVRRDIIAKFLEGVEWK